MKEAVICFVWIQWDTIVAAIVIIIVVNYYLFQLNPSLIIVYG